MTRKFCCGWLMVMLSNLLPVNVNAANWYYAAGSYDESAPVTPVTGLKFYVDHSAIAAYGSDVYTAVFDWNGDYTGKVSAIAKYPASSSSFPDFFLISTDSNLGPSISALTFYYASSGALIGGAFPMDSTSIYKCHIGINPNPRSFYRNKSFSTTYLEKVIRHEVGHVFLLKHPTNLYFSSVMHQDAPNGSIISATVTPEDRNNIIAKWGS